MAKGMRVYVGSRKGAYVLEGDSSRRKWKVRGPYHEGSDVFHVAPDPRHPGRVYAAVNNPFFGPTLQWSKDDGKKWTELAPPMMTVMKERPPPDFSDPEKNVRPIKNLWHITPGPEDEPERLFLGIDPASLFVSNDAGKSWEGVKGINEHESRDQWGPGAGGLCLHTILLDPDRPKRMYIGISAAGMFRTDNGGESWKPANHGVIMDFLPEGEGAKEVGQCVHKVTLDPANPETAYRQDHSGIHVSHDGMENWTRVGKSLKSDFGFVVTAPKSMPGNAFFVPLDGNPRFSPGGQLQVQQWNDAKKTFKPIVKKGLFPGDMGTHRDAFASDDRDPAGLYLGTNGGDLVLSPDAGKSWQQIPYRFPAIHSVMVGEAP